MPFIVKRNHRRMQFYYGFPGRVAGGKEEPKENWTEHRDYAKEFPNPKDVEETFGFAIKQMEEIGFVLEEVYLEE